MKIQKIFRGHFAFQCLVLASMLSTFCFTVAATPYASGLTNNAGTVSFILNEGASDVKIIFAGTTNSLGARSAGLVTAAVGASDPFFVQVSTNSGAGYKTATSNFSGTISWAGKIQISTDPILSRFPTPRGVAVNRNAASPFFGRVYVANSTAGTTAGRAVGRGLYTMNADFSDSPNAYGNTAQTGGLTFPVSANSPYRISVGQDDFVYISDFSDANGNVYRTDGNLQNGQWVFDVVGGPGTLPPGQNHGSTLKAIAEGSLETGDLKVYTIDEDYGSVLNNDLWRYDIDSGPLTNQNLPTLVSSALIGGFSVINDFCKGGTNNYFYAMQNRSSPATTPALYILDSNGATITESRALWREFTGNAAANDVLTNLNSIAISPDGNYLAAVLQGTGNSDTFIIPLTNGIPDFSGLRILDTGTVTQGRGVDFDAAGNLYTISSGDAVLRAFSPGGISVIKTGSDGTFEDLTPTVSVVADSVLVTEGNNTDLIFTRTGDVSAPVTVAYSLSGTANNGPDYALAGSVTFAAGQTVTNVAVAAIDDVSPEFTETIIATILQSTSFAIGSPFAATISIADNETPELSIAAISPSMYERIPDDYATFEISRKGDTSASVTANLSYLGNAAGSRYSAPPTIDINAETVTQTFTISPVDDALFSGDQTIIPTIGSGTGYVTGTTNSASALILDDEYPAEPVLFADPLTADTSASWKINFGANNLVADSLVDFVSNLSGEPVFAPPNGSPTALKLSVNKLDPTTNGAAGINLYPISPSFSGNFALRFSMYIVQNDITGTTEYALFGINHSGNKTNWVRQTGINTFNNPPLDSDGLWFSVISDASGSAPGDFCVFTGTNAASTASVLKSAAATSFTQAFKKPPYNPLSAGAPASIYNTGDHPWADVEVRQVDSIVTMSINKTAVLVYTNTTPFTSGNIMLGYMDPYESIGANGGAVYFSNVRVVALPSAPVITKIQLINNGTQVQIDFTGGAGDTTSSFKLRHSDIVNTGYTDDDSAVISNGTGGAGTFKAVTSVPAANKFYYIRHL